MVTWIIEQSRTYPHISDRVHVLYWYGPAHSLGNSWTAGRPETAAKFPTRDAAESAYRETLGALPDDTRAVRLTDVRTK